MIYRDRKDAGSRLAVALKHFAGQACVVLALPRGGVPVAAEVANVLHAPLDLLLVRKIGAPMQPELAIGAVVDGDKPVIVRNEEVIALTGTSKKEFDAICARELVEIERRRSLYLANRAPLDLKNRIAIVVDDGVATGATMRAGLRATKERNPKKLVLAVPAASPDAIESLRPEADEIVCLESPRSFYAVGQFYARFEQVGDAEVNAILAACRAREAAA